MKTLLQSRFISRVWPPAVRAERDMELVLLALRPLGIEGWRALALTKVRLNPQCQRHPVTLHLHRHSASVTCLWFGRGPRLTEAWSGETASSSLEL